MMDANDVRAQKLISNGEETIRCGNLSRISFDVIRRTNCDMKQIHFDTSTQARRNKIRLSRNNAEHSVHEPKDVAKKNSLPVNWMNDSSLNQPTEEKTKMQKFLSSSSNDRSSRLGGPQHCSSNESMSPRKM